MDEYINANYNSIINGIRDYCIDLTGHDCKGWTRRNTPIEKSALALIKIHQLIEAGYGGNATQGWCITVKDNKFAVYKNDYKFCPFAFHNEKQVTEFLSKTENIELLKDYFMYEEI